MDDWRTREYPRFEFALRFPPVTPGGEPVELAEDRPGEALRVHLRSSGGEVYVEIMRFPPIAAEEEYRTHRLALEARFGAGAVTALGESRIGSVPAWTYAFAWPEGERSALLLRTPAATYRVIHDPRAPLSREIVATIELREGA